MKKKLSILIYSLANGGAERVVSILIQELNDVFDITLFLMNDTIYYDIDPNINIIYLERSNPQEHGLLKLLKLPFLAWKYKRLNQSGISLSFMYRPNYINIIAKLFGMKSRVLVSERDFPSAKNSQGIQGKINLILIKYLYEKAPHIITNSLMMKHDLKTNFNIRNVSYYL